jgi:peptide/nickel transport system substrate-binding protein
MRSVARLTLLVATVLTLACAPAAPATPTTAPKPAGAAPTAAPATAPTAAPATAPTAAPASTPATAPTAAAAPTPATAPAATKPAAAPAAAATKPAEPARPAAGQPRRGGTLVVGTSADPGSLNPGLTTASGTHVVTGNIFSGLLQFDDKLEPQPNLAERWDVAPDGKRYTFYLRKGVKWHDGQPLTSADVKYTFEEVLLKFHSRTKAGLEKTLDGIDTPDESTVVFRFKEPYAPLLRRLDVVEAPIMPKHLYQGTDVQKNPANDKPVGTGPFKLAEYVKGDRVKLVRNPDYFKPGLPYADELVFRVIPNEATALLALENGEVDYVQGVPGADIARLQRSEKVRLVRAPAGPGGSFCIDQVFFNLSKPPLDKLEVRQAFYHAVDRQQILDQVRFGQGRIATGPIASTMAWAYNPNVTKYERSSAKAKELLQKAGVDKLQVTFVHAPGFQRIAEVVRQNMAEVGVEVQLATLEVNAANERMFIKKDFDLGIGSYCGGPDPEVGVTRAYVSSNIGPVPFSNGAGYKNARVDELFQRAATTVDQAQRAKHYQEIQDQLVKDLPYMWLTETELFRAHRAEVQELRVWAGDLAERAWTTR